MISSSFIIFITIFFDKYSYLAYIGPGMGGGVIAAIFGIIAAFFLGLFGILFYPIKRFFKKKMKNKDKKRKKVKK